MGYSCPVCDDPQADARHLANHLAFTALVRGGDHEAWLDEHVPDWESMGEEDLAPEVTEHADETEYPQVFEDTAESHDHQHKGQAESDIPDDVPVADLPDQGDLSAEAADAVERARELTRQRHEDDEGKESQ
ncbi:DUF5810 domain-containing protein [Halovenus salina]|uniref:DUF5810 domain-containing protein n=1 Tax=Halovenus salina TaxID=1510225 RepID=A0ABD5VXW3_9EURY|nr:DUF5810 domain-containing protein [Halovenus salina]